MIRISPFRRSCAAGWPCGRCSSCSAAGPALRVSAEHGLLDRDGIERPVDAALRSGLQGGEREARQSIESAQRRGLDPTRRGLEVELGG